MQTMDKQLPSNIHLEMQLSQLATAVSEEESKLSSQSENFFMTFSEQSIIILEDKMVIEQSNNLTRLDIYE